MSCVSELTTDFDARKSMVASYTTMETLKHIKLYFDTCASHMSKTLKEDLVTINEDQNFGNLDGIDYGLTIWGTGTV